MIRLTIFLILLVPVLGLGNPLQKLVVAVENNTDKTIRYRDIYAPNEPPGTIQKVIVNPSHLPPYQKTKITILFSGQSRLNRFC